MLIIGNDYYTLVDQALDTSLQVPFCVLTGFLLLKRESLGYLLSASSLILLQQAEK